MTDLSVTARALKLATRDLYRALGGQEVAADFAGRSQSRLSHYCNTTNPAMAAEFIPADILVRLEPLTGIPYVTRLLAHASGYALVPLGVASKEDRPWAGRLADLIREAGDVAAHLADSLAEDGRVSAADVVRRDLHGEVREAIQVLVDLNAALGRLDSG
ncbi:hypothetical protein JCM17846_18320 [Iodidimonas nitroreducens]|uniref:Uncharacterized protein n=2 Tax=Iodidimonas TaxID=2066486 RepID=A0A5A7MYI2_9PROT|nr:MULTISPECIES: phage regulatory CII family protein [Iodidimonas]GAK33270.1 hypothetical protein AQ1_01157 [alpha proteobacterium Q-1]GER00908.1 hypothetical protein JCM17845_15310 [Iodidimonas gelatinilytica]GER04150.1 hypothetical protein JCM17846_18320 [Iodidimonas nitroreducens]